ncbi:MAG: outer membrane beta-barrel protein [Alphaproteobacteria bacterium]
MKNKFGKLQNTRSVSLLTRVVLSSFFLTSASGLVLAQENPYADLPPVEYEQPTEGGQTLTNIQEFRNSAPVPVEEIGDPNASFAEGLPAGGFGLQTEIPAGAPASTPASIPVLQQAQAYPDVNLGQPVGASLQFLTADGQVPLKTMAVEELEASPSGKPRFSLYSPNGEYDSELAQCDLVGSEGTATYTCNHGVYGDFYLHARKDGETVEYYHSETASADFGLQVSGFGAEEESEEGGGFLSRFGFLKGGMSSTLNPDAQKKFRTYVAARGLGSLSTSFTNDIVDTTVAPTETYTATTNTSIGYGGSVAAGVRYNLGVAAVRAEIEAAYRIANTSDIVKTNGFASGEASGSATMTSAMLNGLVEMLPNGRFNPYIGGGVGQTNFKFDFQEDEVAYVTESASALTYQAMVGARYNMSDNLSLFGEYRYMMAPGVEITDVHGGVTENDFKNSEVAIGVMYQF